MAMSPPDAPDSPAMCHSALPRRDHPGRIHRGHWRRSVGPSSRLGRCAQGSDACRFVPRRALAPPCRAAVCPGSSTSAAIICGARGGVGGGRRASPCRKRSTDHVVHRPLVSLGKARRVLTHGEMGANLLSRECSHMLVAPGNAVVLRFNADGRPPAAPDPRFSHFSHLLVRWLITVVSYRLAMHIPFVLSSCMHLLTPARPR